MVTPNTAALHKTIMAFIANEMSFIPRCGSQRYFMTLARESVPPEEKPALKVRPFDIPRNTPQNTDTRKRSSLLTITTLLTSSKNITAGYDIDIRSIFLTSFQPRNTQTIAVIMSESP